MYMYLCVSFSFMYIYVFSHFTYMYIVDIYIHMCVSFPYVYIYISIFIYTIMPCLSTPYYFFLIFCVVPGCSSFLKSPPKKTTSSRSLAFDTVKANFQEAEKNRIAWFFAEVESFSATPLKFNMAPEKKSLEKVIPFGNHPFRFHVKLRGSSFFFPTDICHGNLRSTWWLIVPLCNPCMVFLPMWMVDLNAVSCCGKRTESCKLRYLTRFVGVSPTHEKLQCQAFGLWDGTRLSLSEQWTKTACSGYVGDEFLPSYVGIIS